MENERSAEGIVWLNLVFMFTSAIENKDYKRSEEIQHIIKFFEKEYKEKIAKEKAIWSRGTE